MNRAFNRHGWVAGLVLVLVLLLAFTKFIQPNFGVSGLDSLARATLPFAFATAAMAVVVIGGGIDLSVASMMAVAGVTGAVLMEGSADAAALPVVGVVLCIGIAMGAINGALIVVTRVPDIVVTLAMLFVWEGVALLILNAPGGASAEWLRAMIVGPVTLGPLVVDWLPRAFVVLAVAVALVWLPIRRAKPGLSIYAMGSDELAAWRSGVNIRATRITAYAICGLFASMGGLALTLSTGNGEPIPGPYLMASVAAVVLGGCVLGGGKGGLLGPIVAVFILRLVRLDLTLMSVDPNVATIVEGLIMVAVVMLGGVIALRGKRR